MKYQLQNEKIIVTVASKGAEMQSMIRMVRSISGMAMRHIGQTGLRCCSLMWEDLPMGNIKLERKSTRWGSMDLPKTVSSPL